MTNKLNWVVNYALSHVLMCVCVCFSLNSLNMTDTIYMNLLHFSMNLPLQQLNIFVFRIFFFASKSKYLDVKYKLLTTIQMGTHNSDMQLHFVYVLNN